MNMFIQHSVLGNLEIIEVYEYFDKPLLFACKNEINTFYLVTLVSEDEDEEFWLISPMSNYRFEQVRSGAIDLYTAFKKSETAIVFNVFIPFDNRGQMRICDVPVVDISDEHLPVPGEFLNLTTLTLPQIPSPTERARQSRREQVDLALDTTTPERVEVSAYRLGAILSNFQKFINAIGNKNFGKGGIKGGIPQNIIDDMQLNVVGYSAGSFETNMASARIADLFDDTTISDAISDVLGLIRIVEDREALHARLMDLGSRVASVYVEFLEAIAVVDVVALEIDWGSPHPEKGGSASISSQVAQHTARTIKSYEEQSSRELEIIGVLIGANLRTMRFELEVDGSSLSGSIDEDAKDYVHGAVLGEMYRVRIREIEKFKPMVEESTIQFILLHLGSVAA